VTRKHGPAAKAVDELSQKISHSVTETLDSLDEFRQSLARLQVEPPSLSRSRAALARLNRSRPKKSTEDPGGSALQAQLATLHRTRQQGDGDALREALHATLQLKSLDVLQRASLAVELGQILYYDLEDPEGALQWFEEAATVDPEGAGANPEVLTALEGIHEDLDNPEGLRAVYERRLKHTSDTAMQQIYGLLLGELLTNKMNDLEGAREAYLRVLDLDDQNAPAAKALARLARERGETPQAIGYLRLLTDSLDEDDFERPDALRDLVATLSQHAKAADADAEIAPTATEARIEAAAILRGMLDQDPSDADALSLLKPILAALGKYDEARQLLTRELERELGEPPDMDRIVLVDGWDHGSVEDSRRFRVSTVFAEMAAISHQAEDRTIAWVLYGHAIQLSPENIEILAARVELGRSLIDGGDTQVKASLADDLDAMADALLDEAEQDAHRAEAAKLRAPRQ
jgi:tetratricopeptide (TPR) repeat protein